MDSWWEAKLSVPEPMREAVSNRAFELGSGGVLEHNSGDLSAYVPEKGKVYFEEQMRQFFHSLETMSAGEYRLEFFPVDIKDWTAAYQEFYTARPLSEKIFLVPTWQANVEVPSNMIPIKMELGQAFGTGLHATTRLCVVALEKELAQSKPLRAIDVGTGTGILAIIMKKFGVSQVEAIDIDPIAVEAAQSNAALNGVAFEVSDKPLSDFKEPYEFIVSNILLEVHERLIKDYVRLLAIGGRLILSGLLVEHRAEILELLSSHGFVVVKEFTEGEWVALVVTR